MASRFDTQAGLQRVRSAVDTYDKDWAEIDEHPVRSRRDLMPKSPRLEAPEKRISLPQLEKSNGQLFRRLGARLRQFLALTGAKLGLCPSAGCEVVINFNTVCFTLF